MRTSMESASSRQNIERVEIDKVIAERGEVCVMYDLVSKQSGAIPTVGWYKTRNGKVTAVRAFFDARRLLARPRRDGSALRRRRGGRGQRVRRCLSGS